MSALPEVGDDTFQSEVLDHEGLVLVDFWATWCGPCKKMKPVIEEIAAGTDAFKAVAVDIEAAPEAAQRFEITSVPTLIMLRDGAVEHEIRGGRTRAALLNELAPYLNETKE